MDPKTFATLQQALVQTIQITSIMSTIVPLIIICCFLLVKELRKIEFFMIAMMNLGDLIAALTLGIAVSYDQQHPGVYEQVKYSFLQVSNFRALCTVQGFFELFGSLFSFAWTSSIAYSLKLSTKLVSPERRASLQARAIAFSFIVPTILSILPLFHKDYKQSAEPLLNSICFAKGGVDDPIGNTMLFICFYIPLVLVFLFNLDCMWSVYLQFSRLTSDPVILREIKHLLTYPAILAFCWIWFLVLRIADLFVDDNFFVFQIICYGTSNLNGFFDGIAYGMNALLAYKVRSDQPKHSVSSGRILLDNSIGNDVLTQTSAELSITKHHSHTFLNRSLMSEHSNHIDY